jgi:hypothetical protein
MKRSGPLAFLVPVALALTAAVAWWGQSAPARPTAGESFALAPGQHWAHAIALPPTADAVAREAAALLQHTLSAATGWPLTAFPPQRVTSPAARFRLEVRPSSATQALEATLDRTVGYRVTRDHVVIWARHHADLAAAVSWFLERRLDARWFLPGALGAEIPRRSELKLAPGEESFAPSYVSREFYFYSAPAGPWAAANRLVRVFAHGHNFTTLFQPQDFVREPAMAPEFHGQRRLPTGKNYSWQPNLSALATLDFITTKFRAQLRRPQAPRQLNFGPNDSRRWDQSPATLEALAPPRFFRNRPVYSESLFGFLNQLAMRLAPDAPDTLIATYAYDWTEQVPRFPVHPNVLPFLTADRSQWFDPAYRAEDQDLIRRWAAAGPRVIGLYDYYYGAPFLVPRPTLYTVTQSIPFGFTAGARAFFAETHPNWGLDGPKLWLAAQLLWDARKDPAALLAAYYDRFWQEAATPMRAFYEACDRQYLTQPRSPYWLKFYRDEHQHLLYPTAVRAELNAQLERAAALARTPRVQERVAFVRRAFAVSEAFCTYNETRDQLATLLLQDNRNPAALQRAVETTTAAREVFIAKLTALQRDLPGAIATKLPDTYLWNDPRPRALRRLAELGVNPPVPPELATTAFAGRAPAPTAWNTTGTVLIRDASFSTVRLREGHPFTTLEWTETSRFWQGLAEPAQSRRIRLEADETFFRTVRFEGSTEGGIYQSNRIEPGALYRATVRVRARVSPGNTTALYLSFADQNNRPDEPGFVDRLPVGSWHEWTTLELYLRAPRHARALTLGLLASGQVEADFAEFSRPWLERIEEAPASKAR